MVADNRIAPWAPAHPFEFGVDLPASTFNRMAFPDNPWAAALASLSKGILAIRKMDKSGRRPAAAKEPKPTYDVDAEGNITPSGGNVEASAPDDREEETPGTVPDYAGEAGHAPTAAAAQIQVTGDGRDKKT